MESSPSFSHDNFNNSAAPSTNLGSFSTFYGEDNLHEYHPPPEFLPPPRFCTVQRLRSPRFLPPPRFSTVQGFRSQRFPPPPATPRFATDNRYFPPPTFAAPSRFGAPSRFAAPDGFNSTVNFQSPAPPRFEAPEPMNLLLEYQTGNTATTETTSDTTSGKTSETMSDTTSGSNTSSLKTKFDNLTEDEIRGSLTGYEAQTLDEIFSLYQRHSVLIGFSVRKATTRRVPKTGELKEQYLCCSKQGKRREEKSKNNEELPLPCESKPKKESKQTRKQDITRTGCNAQIRVKLNCSGMFEIKHHVIEHNHDLARLSLQHFHRSERKIDEDKAQVIEGLALSGIQPADSYRYMCNESGDPEVLGHTLIDHMNFSSRLKMKTIEGKDSQAVVNMLIRRGEEEPDFFYRVKLNEKNQVIGIYWRDGMMKEDYDIYGDVCVFDTTFRTNKYNLVCAPFVGVNNHWSNVMFGCAFIADEKTDTFVWLLEVFLESMGEKAPVTIFTDQDQTMANAIEQVFPHTRHRLCLWHLQKNAVSRFGDLKADTTFKDTFKKCLYGCFNEEQFETTWFEMIQTYGLQNHEWFTNLYTIKEKWCTALNKDFFSAGILSSQRSESTNNAIGFKGNKSTTLTEFFHIFGATVDRWRYQEDQNEFNCGNSMPKSDFPMVGMIKHAASVYTLTLFRDFKKEFKYAMGCISTIHHMEDNFIGYKVQHESWPDHTAKHVAFDPSTNSIACNCRNFEESGWLCFHAIRVLHVHSIINIPDKYICKRWTKFAKSEVWKRVEQREDNGIEKRKITPWRYEMARNFYNLVLKCQDSDEAKKVLRAAYASASDNINKVLEAEKAAQKEAAQKEAEDVAPTSSSSNALLEYPGQFPQITVQNPPQIKTKGRSKRKKGHFEVRESSTTAKEFGTFPTKPQLF
ncbi:protein FAR1-RELATED SEQUENCE 5-like [Spinacia oleracea]|uniref:Protein FAR1-RELATED SEQUENCE 5-like n=1 Tax=Spinacia oleracea TaxID=3562 RepID=A0A9R0JJE6_SPIOL|nr:protein FAR1-RELATED SEQUENCE 5-like [Spinacia oleracea]